MTKRTPCGNEACDSCYPLPRFKVSIERVQRLFYERTVKAKDEAEAIRIVEGGTPWPTQYDDRYGETLEQKDPVVTLHMPEAELRESGCWTDLEDEAAPPSD